MQKAAQKRIREQTAELENKSHSLQLEKHQLEGQVANLQREVEKGHIKNNDLRWKLEETEASKAEIESRLKIVQEKSSYDGAEHRAEDDADGVETDTEAVPSNGSETDGPSSSPLAQLTSSNGPYSLAPMMVGKQRPRNNSAENQSASTIAKSRSRKRADRRTTISRELNLDEAKRPISITTPIGNNNEDISAQVHVVNGGSKDRREGIVKDPFSSSDDLVSPPPGTINPAALELSQDQYASQRGRAKPLANLHGTQESPSLSPLDNAPVSNTCTKPHDRILEEPYTENSHKRSTAHKVDARLSSPKRKKQTAAANYSRPRTRSLARADARSDTPERPSSLTQTQQHSVTHASSKKNTRHMNGKNKIRELLNPRNHVKS